MNEDRDNSAGAPRTPANDNSEATPPVDPRIRAIARAIGRLMAREQFRAANDNHCPPGHGKGKNQRTRP